MQNREKSILCTDSASVCVEVPTLSPCAFDVVGAHLSDIPREHVGIFTYGST